MYVCACAAPDEKVWSKAGSMVVQWAVLVAKTVAPKVAVGKRIDSRRDLKCKFVHDF